MSDLETLIMIIKYLIGPGAGIAVKKTVDWIVRERTDDGKPPSPKTKRRLTYLVSLLLPSALYGLLAAFMWQYDPAAHIMAILAAFGFSQVIHGEQNLPSGKDVKVANVE